MDCLIDSEFVSVVSVSVCINCSREFNVRIPGRALCLRIFQFHLQTFWMNHFIGYRESDDDDQVAFEYET